MNSTTVRQTQARSTQACCTSDSKTSSNRNFYALRPPTCARLPAPAYLRPLTCTHF